MHRFQKITELLSKATASIREDHISAFSAYSSFFLMMSFLPAAILVYTVFNVFGIDLLRFIGYANAKEANLLLVLKNASLSSTAVISMSTIFTAWSAGRAFHALTEGFGVILKTEIRKNYFIMRLRSLAFSLLFSVVFAMIITFGVFGNQTYHTITQHLNLTSNRVLFKTMRFVFSFSALFIILLVTYSFVPYSKSLCNKKHKKAPVLISSALCSVVINLYTTLFSYLFGLFHKDLFFYGSMNLLATVMLWIYGALYVVFVGFKLYVTLK